MAVLIGLLLFMAIWAYRVNRRRPYCKECKLYLKTDCYGEVYQCPECLKLHYKDAS